MAHIKAESLLSPPSAKSGGELIAKVSAAPGRGEAGGDSDGRLKSGVGTRMGGLIVQACADGSRQNQKKKQARHVCNHLPKIALMGGWHRGGDSRIDYRQTGGH